VDAGKRYKTIGYALVYYLIDTGKNSPAKWVAEKLQKVLSKKIPQEPFIGRNSQDKRMSGR
jgi:hypothetical protein